MQAAHQYISSKPRSRSPSPHPVVHRKRKNSNKQHGKDDGSDGRFLCVNSAASDQSDLDEQSDRAPIISSLSHEEAPINRHLQHSHPVRNLIKDRDSPQPAKVVVKELLDRQDTQRRGSGELDELSGHTRTSSVNNYGSIRDSELASQSGDTEYSANGGGPSARLDRQKSYYTPAMEDTLRKRNQLYFMDPITKLKNFHSFPWKMILQIVKIFMITAQVISFDDQRSNTMDYFERGDLAFNHLLMKGWDPTLETMPYPKAIGQYALYSLEGLYDHINYVTSQYYVLPESSLASIHHYYDHDQNTTKIRPISLCFKANKYQEFSNGSYVVLADLLQNCTEIHPFVEGNNMTYDIKRYLKETNFSVQFNRTLELGIHFHIGSFHLNLVETHYGPTCYNVSVHIKYTNVARSGQLLVDLDANRQEIGCHGKILSKEVHDETKSLQARYIAFDAAVIACCVLSTLLCGRSLSRSNKLRKDTAKFFFLQKGQPFSLSHHLQFINMWYIVIIVNDVLTIVGSAIKIQLDNRTFDISSENYGICSMLLGIGIFLTYVGVLRYLGFFKSYNVLILTLRTSAPHVIRFLVCALCLYLGFLFCGWIVFSPYHIKFRKLSTSSECLFSLVNGDDMFVTFSALENHSNYIWYFHRAYLYIFISLFIYVVLSVFIAVIMDNYENLKHYYEEGFPQSEVDKFINENGKLSTEDLFSHVKRDGSWQSWLFCIFPCLGFLRSDQQQHNAKGERKELLATI